MGSINKLAWRLSLIFIGVVLLRGGKTKWKFFALKYYLVDSVIVDVIDSMDVTDDHINATNNVVPVPAVMDSKYATDLNTMNSSVPTKSLYNNYDAFRSPQTRCRHELEVWQNKNYDKWISEDEPWMEWAWELTEEHENHQTGEPHYVALIISANLGQKNKIDLDALEWFWQDQYGNNFTTRNDSYRKNRKGRFYLHMDPPVDAEKMGWHEESESIRLMNRTFSKSRQSTKRATKGRSVPAFIWSKATASTKSLLYDIRPYLKCNQIERMNPPPSHIKIGACVVRFWGQHDLMAEWLAYHRMIGIQHFWLFVSEDFDNFILKSNLPRHDPDITYIPYNYRWFDHMHLKPDAKPGWKGEALFQPSGNNQCLFMAKTYNLDWIITPDVDEFIAVEDPVLNESFPLQSVLEKVEQQYGENVGSFCMPSFAYKWNVLKESTDSFELSIDFTYRRNKTLGDKGGGRKCFYKPRIVKDVSVHYRNVGGKEVKLNHAGICLHHYRTPLVGHPLKETSSLASYPSLRDIYRKKILQALRSSNATLPNFHAHMGDRNEDKK